MSISQLPTSKVVRFADGFEVAKGFLPKVEPLDVNATIEMKAATYGIETLWRETGTGCEGFPIYQCVSPVSQELYTVAYNSRRGHYCCNCQAGDRIKKLPVHQAEPTCWHLYEFNSAFLPVIMAARRASQAPPTPEPFTTRRTGEMGSHRCGSATGRASGCLGVSSYPAPVSGATYTADWGTH